jgi:hypothetical protein
MTVKRSLRPDFAHWRRNDRELAGWLVATFLMGLTVVLFPAPILSFLTSLFAPYGQAIYNVLTMLLAVFLVMGVLLLLVRHHAGDKHVARGGPQA